MMTSVHNGATSVEPALHQISTIGYPVPAYPIIIPEIYQSAAHAAMHAAPKIDCAAGLTSWMQKVRWTLHRTALRGKQFTVWPRWRQTDAHGHLGAAPPGVRRADTRSPRGARRLRFTCRSTRPID